MKKYIPHAMQSIRKLAILLLLTGITLPALAFEPDTTVQQNLSKVQDEEKVEMEVVGFWDYMGSGIAVFLKEKGSEEEIYVPIFIGDCEAIALSREKAGVEFSRPLTYPLFGNLLDTAGIELKEVIITQIKDNTYYAIIVFEQGDQRWELDARPSDAMNLAIRMKSKVFAYRKVIEQAGEKIGD